VCAGDYLCIVGENGSGKSTLLRGMLGLIEPYDGDIVRDENLSNKEIGYLPQQTNVQKDFPAGVYEVVISGRLGNRGIRPFWSAKDKEAATKAIVALKLEDVALSCYRELSGGQQQRVLLARAICASESLKMLFLDEPTRGLDPSVTEDFYEHIARINSETGVSVVMVSHDMPNTLKYCKQILCMHTKQLFYGTKEEFEYYD
jgi:zinc transport system ATP-binding protein